MLLSTHDMISWFNFLLIPSRKQSTRVHIENKIYLLRTNGHRTKLTNLDHRVPHARKISFFFFLCWRNKIKNTIKKRLQAEPLRRMVPTKMPAWKQTTSLITHTHWKKKKNLLLLLHEWMAATAIYRLWRSNTVINAKWVCFKWYAPFNNFF